MRFPSLKTISRYLILPAILLAMSFSLYASAVSAAGTPSIMSYQGRLTNASGSLLGGSGTTYYFKFSIWDVATGGSAGTNRLWPASDPTSVSLNVRNGVFTVNIGDTDNGYPDALTYDFNTDSDVYLQVEVSSDNSTFQALTPRQRIASTPFSRLSGAVSGTGQSSFGTTAPFGPSVVSIAATSTNTTALSLRGILNQLANIFQIQDSTGAHLFSVNSGGVFSSSTVMVGSSNSAPQLRLSQSGAVYGEVYTDPAGDVKFSSTGGNIRAQDENLWVCSGGSCGVDTPVDKGNVVVETSVIFNNKFRLKQVDASTTVMYDSIGNSMLEFDEGQ